MSSCFGSMRRMLEGSLVLAATTGAAIANAQVPPPPGGAAPPAAAAAPPPPAAPAPAPSAVSRITSWLDLVDISAFVDSYFSLNWRVPRANAAANLYHPFDPHTGFGLSWFGLDALVEPDPIGGQVSVRLGPSVPNLALGDQSLPGGIGNLQNAYLTYRPGGKEGRFTLVAGKFDTVFGAEVAASQLNINYTRGALYNLAQPFFHTGLRADWQATDKLVVKLLAVNGWNNTLDNNLGKSLGLQLSYAVNDRLGISLGYMTGPEQPDTLTVTCDPGTTFDPATGACATRAGGAGGTHDVDVAGANRRWRHLADLVIDFNPTQRVRILANGDFVADRILVDPVTGKEKTVMWYGGSLMARVAITSIFAVGARGEIIVDPDAQISAPNTKKLTLATGTLTLEAAPTKYLLVRLDTRVDAANQSIFPAGLADTSKTQITSTLGIVAKTK